jgi:hypothetical protein
VIPNAWPAEHGGPAKVPVPIAMSPDAEWCLQPPSEPLVVFRGLEAADSNAFGGSAMLYPAPSAAAALAAVATHAAIVGGVRAKRAQEHAEAANKVLEPYQAVLGSFRTQELADRTLDARTSDGAHKLACNAGRGASTWIIESAPVFFMTQDQTALVLDNMVAMYPPGTPSRIAYRHEVRVVSARLDAAAAAANWLADDGAKLKSESVALFGQSLDVAFRVAAGNPVRPDTPFKSFHYYEGASDMVERAQLASETCERLLLRTLRATFLSVPTTRTDCGSDGQMPRVGAAPTPH